jgi:energy-converting hydrogenase Eha subunit H
MKMKKLIAIIAVLALTGGIAFAAATTGTFGDQNASKVYRMSADTDGKITLASDTILTGGTIDATAIGTNTAAAAKVTTLNISGIVIDTQLYAGTAGTGGNRTVCVSADGKLFSSATACP